MGNEYPLGFTDIGIGLVVIGAILWGVSGLVFGRQKGDYNDSKRNGKRESFMLVFVGIFAILYIINLFSSP